MKKLVVVGTMLALALAACSMDQSKAPAPAAADTQKKALVVVTAGDVKILDSDVQDFLAQMPEQERAQYESPEALKKVFTSLVAVKLVAEEARKKGMDKAPGMKFRLDLMADQVLAKSLAEEAVKSVKVSDEDVAKYYSENKDKYAVGERVRLRHILVPTEAEAKAILAKLKKGADFATLAKEKSKCPSAERGGDLEWVTKGSMVPEFDKAAFELKKGQMSGIVKTRFGFHIIKCEDVQAPRQLSLDEVRDDILNQLRNDRGETTVKDLVENVKKGNPMTFNEEFFSKFAKPEAKDQPVSGEASGAGQKPADAQAPAPAPKQ